MGKVPAEQEQRPEFDSYNPSLKQTNKQNTDKRSGEVEIGGEDPLDLLATQSIPVSDSVSENKLMVTGV